ncbi:MAG TPA: hypothetical protein VM529_27055 [Gemmata sp.]|nr:hypothetical protein [Gemmata sp.]
MTTDEVAMREQLQKVAAYRELRRGVRRSGRDNIIFGSLMLYLTYLLYTQGAPPAAVVVYGVLVGAELLVGLFKWLNPSPEGALLDGLVVLAFAGVNLAGFLAGPQPPTWVALLALFLVANAIGQFQRYALLRRLFADRPTAAHVAWFDDLVNEIRTADPEADEQAIDLPTGPHWKAKLLGSMAFFVALRGGEVWVAGPEEFEILREKADRGTGRRKARLTLHAEPYPEFEIADASWANYAKWRAANPAAPLPA